MLKSNSKTYKILVGICSIVITAVIGVLIVWAGSLTPPGPPGSTMHDLNEIAGSNFASTTASLKAIRDRGDTAWITATGFPLATDYTSARAAKLDNLDALISSRLAAASYVTERGTDGAALASNYTATRAGYLDRLDATVSSRLAAASYTAERGTDGAALASNYTATRAGYLDRLDATISSRASAGDSKPGSWTCVVRVGEYSANESLAQCSAGEVLILGRCACNSINAMLTNNPSGQGWICNPVGAFWCRAYANCCQ